MARVQPPDNQARLDGLDHILCPICHRSNLPRARYCQHCGRDVVLNNDGPTYRITRIIKEGGQGAVYEVISEDGRTYALKEMLERMLDPKEHAEAIERFEFEANVLQHLKHPRIPRVYDHFKDEGRNYLAMDFVRGEDLEELLKRDGKLPEERVLAYADQICDVLDYLHTNGLIYRDMKPSNIMIEPDGGIKMIDFGIAKLFQKSERGTQIGTPGYAPPEQYQGIATAESDIYALGATLHHALTGRDPRDEAPFSFPPVTDLAPLVSRRTADAIARALQMKPEGRFSSVLEFRTALRPLPSTPTIRTVRRAPAPQPVPARPQSAGVPQPVAGASQPAPRVQPAPAPRVQPAPVPQAQPAPIAAPAPVPKRGGFFAAVGRFLRSLMILAVLTVALALGGWFFLPSAVQPVVRPYLPDVVTNLLPTAVPTLGPVLASSKFEADVEASVPANADDATIRQALVAQYAAAVAAKRGPNAKINMNIPVTTVGAPELVRTNADGTQTYRVTLSGWVQG